MERLPEEAITISHEFQNQFFLEFDFPAARCKNREPFDFETEWKSVEDIVDTMERNNPMLRAWRRDASIDEVSPNTWERFFGKTWPSARDASGELKETVIPESVRQYFHQGWTGYNPLPRALLIDRLM